MADTPQPASQNEQDLICRIKGGEKELFYDLIRPYQRTVYMMVLSLLQNEADAEEVAQQAIMKALANLTQFRFQSKFSTWLVQIALNEAKMRRRKDRNDLHDSIDEEKEGEEGHYAPIDLADWREIPSEALERKELRAALLSGFASLQAKYREVFVLRDVAEFSTAEVAVVLNLTEATVKTRLSRSRLQMRDAVAPGLDGSWGSGTSKYQAVRRATFY
jgi:RNA polymerase sigma-70 factor, ECF subfamily